MNIPATSLHATDFRSRILCIILLCAVLLGVSFVFSQRTTAAPVSVPTVVADTADSCTKAFFGLEPWYTFMPAELGVPASGSQKAQKCSVRCFNIFSQTKPNACGQTKSDIPGILLAIVDDLLRIAGLVAIAFILVGSFQYVGSRGNSERTAKAQSTIASALVGLIVALVAVALVSFIGRSLS